MQFPAISVACLVGMAKVAESFTVQSTSTFVGPVSTTALQFAPTQTSTDCNCPACVGGFGFSPVYSPVCDCPNCLSLTTLQMSDADAEPEAEAETDEIPPEVAAMDGVADDTEAHNTERPARASGTAKHKRSKGKAIADLEVGSTVDGTIKTITSYGAFVDVGAATDALLHVSRLSADFVSDVNEIVKVGETVPVRIVSVDVDKNQIALSMLSAEEEANAAAAQQARSSGGKRKERPQRSQGDRRAQAETIAALADAGHDASTFIEGEVVSVLDFGAFVRFDAGQLAESVTGELDGLVHISSLKAERVNSVASVVNVSDKVQIRVKGVDKEGGKVSLSMITEEQEQAARQGGGGGRGGGGGGGRGRMFSDNEMGAKDWKESLEKFKENADTFTNAPVINRK